MKALILSGGKGTRLKPLTHTGAKQLVPVANKPILFYVIEDILSAGITDIGIVISPETGKAVREAVEKANYPDTKITWIEQKVPGGIAHAVKEARDFLQDSLFVLYLGDNLIQQRLSESLAYEVFKHGEVAAQILLKKVDNPRAFGIATLNADGTVKRLIEKPKNPESDWAMIGIYLFTPKIHEIIAQLRPSNRGELEITEAIQGLLDSGHKVGASRTDGWWLDTGKKEDLLVANHIVIDEYIQYDFKGQMDKQTTVVGRVSVGAGTVIKDSILRGPCVIGDNCVVYNSTVNPFSSVGDGSMLHNSKIQNSVLMERCVLENVDYLEDSLLARGVVVSSLNKATHPMILSLGEDSEVKI